MTNFFKRLRTSINKWYVDGATWQDVATPWIALMTLLTSIPSWWFGFLLSRKIVDSTLEQINRTPPSQLGWSGFGVIILLFLLALGFWAFSNLFLRFNRILWDRWFDKRGKCLKKILKK